MSNSVRPAVHGIAAATAMAVRPSLSHYTAAAPTDPPVDRLAPRPTEDQPEQVSPKWCTRRGLMRYNEKCALQIAAVLGRGLLIDFGCGHGLALDELADEAPDAHLVGVNAHQIDGLSGRFEHLYAKVPTNPIIWSRFANRARFTTDIYGAASYCDDPLEALIYEAGTLAAGGTGVVYTEGDRFAPRTWEPIQRFFHDVTRQQVEFAVDPLRGTGDTLRPKEPEGKFGGGHVTRWQNCLRITVEGGGAPLPFQQVSQLARQRVGTPQPGRLLWATQDMLGKIYSVDYVIAA